MNDQTIDSDLLVTGGSLSTLAAAEYDMQVSTAKRYPRSVTAFLRSASELVTLNEQVARQCIYALPRGDKTILGPSARFAEIVQSMWGNNLSGGRVVDEQEEFIIAEGVFHDLERNAKVTIQIPRRIVDSRGRRFNLDMIGVTGSAATSIALRNAVLKGIPRALWEGVYTRAHQVVAGDYQTLSTRRHKIIEEFAPFGVTQPMILARLEKSGLPDVTLDDIVMLVGLLNHLKEGTSTVEEMFTVGQVDAQNRGKDPAAGAVKPPRSKSEKAAAEKAAAPAPSGAQPAANESPASVDPDPASVAAADAAASAAGLATPAEKAYIKRKLAELNITVEEACREAGIRGNFENLAADGFIKLRDLIRGAGK